MTRALWALGYGTASATLVASGHRFTAGLVVVAAIWHLAVVGRATLDHVIPHSRGGTDTWDNLVTACWDCNRDKGNRTPDEWRSGIVVDSVARERVPIPAHVREAVYQRDGGRCVYCSAAVD